MPYTYTNLNSFIMSKFHPNGLWFVKSTYGSNGKSVYCATNKNDVINIINKYMLNNNFIIQQGINNPLLINKHKFTIRSYILIAPATIYVYNDSIVIIHKEEYIKNSTNRKIQIEHICPTYKYLSDFHFYNEINNQIKSIVAKIANIITNEESYKYHLFGYDFVCDENMKTYLIEINAYPNLTYKNDIHRQIKENMLNDMFNIIINPYISNCKNIYCGNFTIIK